MKNAKIMIGLILLLALKSSAQQMDPGQPMSQPHHLMPVPAALQFQTGRLKINASFTVAAADPVDARLEAGIFRAARRLEGRTGFTFSRAPINDLQTATLRIECQGPGSAVPSINE